MRNQYYPTQYEYDNNPTYHINNPWYVRQLERRIKQKIRDNQRDIRLELGIDVEDIYPHYFLQRLIQCDKCKYYFSFNMYPQDYSGKGNPYKYIYKDYEKTKKKKNICNYCTSDKWLTEQAKARLSSQGIRSHMLNTELIENEKKHLLIRLLLKNYFHRMPYMKFKTPQI